MFKGMISDSNTIFIKDLKLNFHKEMINKFPDRYSIQFNDSLISENINFKKISRNKLEHPISSNDIYVSNNENKIKKLSLNQLVNYFILNNLIQ